MALRKAISILAIFSLAFVLWVLLFAASGTSGIPARQILAHTCSKTGFEAAQAAFQTEEWTKTDYVIAGLPSFVDQTSDILPESAKIVSIPMDTVSLEQYGSIVSVFTPRLPKAFILQNAPHLWIDLDDPLATGEQYTDAWVLSTQDLRPMAALSQAIKAFRSLTEVLTGTCRNQKKPAHLPDDFLWTSFLPEPFLSSKKELFYLEIKTENAADAPEIYWVFDEAWIPDSAEDDTREALVAFSTGPRNEKGLGEMVTAAWLSKHFGRSTDQKE